MTTLETAIKYGVPMPETCELLNYKEPTLFRWLNDTLCVQQIYYRNYQKRYILMNVENGNYETNTTFDNGLPAPQMHEIAPLLPNELVNNNIHYPLNLWNYTILHENETIISLGYTSEDGIYLKPRIDVQRYHYAEAYAQLYIKLKKEGLI